MRAEIRGIVKVASVSTARDIEERIAADLRDQGIQPEISGNIVKFTNNNIMQNSLSRYAMVNKGEFVVCEKNEIISVKYAFDLRKLIIFSLVGSLAFTIFNLSVNIEKCVQMIGLGALVFSILFIINVILIFARNWLFLKSTSRAVQAI